MKKQIILTALTVFLALAVTIDTHAQNKVWSMGPEAGVSISKFGMDASTNDAKPGIVAGGFVTYSVVNNFAFTTKFLYYQKGASYAPTDTKQTLRYFEIPIIARYFLTKQGFFRPNIFLGPSFSLLTGVNQHVGNRENEVQNFKDVYNRPDVGVTTGAGFNFLIAKETYFILEARYTHGLTDVTKANGNINNNSVALTAGISFGF